MEKTFSTAAPFKYDFGAGAMNNTVDVPAGVRCVPIDGEPGQFWVADLSFLSANGIDRHDATYRGIRVSASNIIEWGR